MNGVFIIDKEKNVTSRDVVNEIGKKFNIKKVGHTGTLDPIATGVLVICVGRATKLVDLLTCHDKEYIAECTLGIQTDTLDITGKILKEEKCYKTKDEIIEVLESFNGEYIQEVPKYSSIKVKGKKLYEYARNNEYVELPKRKVIISSIKLLDLKYEKENTIFTFKCDVSKGTYIRSLIRDIALKLNTIGTMSDLRRTRVGKFNIEDAKLIKDIKEEDLIKIQDILDVPKMEINSEIEKKVLNGTMLDNIDNIEEVLYLKDGNPIALYKAYENDNSKLKPYKMFKGGM